MKLDMHVHTSYSSDGIDTLEVIVKYAKKIGLKGIAVTDHNEIKGSKRATEFSNNDFLVIPGIEVSSNNGHIIGYNITEDIQKNKSIEETVDAIHSLGGIAVIAHPFGLRSGANKKQIINTKFDAIEAFNARSFIGNKEAEKFADILKLGKTGGSDCHRASDVGKGFTELKMESYKIDDIINEILNKRSAVGGTPLPFIKAFYYVAKSPYSWITRGMERV